MFFFQSPTANFSNSCEGGDVPVDDTSEDPSKEQARRHSDILRLAFRSGTMKSVMSFELFLYWCSSYLIEASGGTEATVDLKNDLKTEVKINTTPSIRHEKLEYLFQKYIRARQKNPEVEENQTETANEEDAESNPYDDEKR